MPLLYLLRHNLYPEGLEINKIFCSHLGNNICLKLDQVLDMKNVNVILAPKWIEKENNRQIFMTIFSLSAPKNFDARQKLRQEIQTFKDGIDEEFLGSVHLTFLLGLSNNTDVMQSIEEESHQEGDVLQLSVMDSYNNLSYKTLGAYEWILKVWSLHCDQG